jgi:hypothetical protein
MFWFLTFVLSVAEVMRCGHVGDQLASRTLTLSTRRPPDSRNCVQLMYRLTYDIIFM